MTKDTTVPATPTQPAKKRTRGPNKPKPKADLIQIATDASISQTAIVTLLRDYATKFVGQEAADAMVLQTWKPLGTGDGQWSNVQNALGETSDCGTIRFVTVRK